MGKRDNTEIEKSKGRAAARKRVHERRKKRRIERRLLRQEKQNLKANELDAGLQRAVEEKDKEIQRQKVEIEALKLQLQKEKEFRKKSMQLPSIRPWDLTVSPQEIGKGSYGTVLIANFGTMAVVVKNIDRSVTTLKMAQTEAHFLHNLRHPNLPLLIGVDFDAVSNYKIVMPLYSVNGSPVNLLDAMSKRLVKIGVRNTWLDVLIQITKAIDYIHKAGVLHNDLKSNNVVLHQNDDSKLKAVVIDFGKASFIADGYVSSQCSNKRHIAPEPEKSTASDIYSLGCIIKDAFGLVKVLGQIPLLQDVYRKCREVSPIKRPTATSVFKSLRSCLI
ncbi:probable CTD kinase subunit alpha homolog [Exaiptasia diaphana]|uniref:Protein kinase domain-containing protein n=1 Tax=Exaiptasia diaphana TaxID=2652724 RepID=A0A913Y7I8_EXADI|nr:probable CTD kinase subunit alpha homolog [Exaiptasia diaphana]